MKKILKIIFVILVILAVLFITWRVSLFVFVRNIEKKTFENFKGNYYYKVSDSNHIETEYWVSEDYLKLRRMRTADFWLDKKNNIFVMKSAGEDVTIEYDQENAIMFSTNMFSNEQKTYMTYWSWDNILYSIKALSLDNLLGDIYYLFDQLILYPMTSVKSITTENIKGKECYKIELTYLMGEFETYYIEKETCLPIRAYRKEEVQDKDDNYIYMREFEYSFGTITEEDFRMPSVDNCYVIVK